MSQLFPNASVNDLALGYESNVEADYAFICVPTPNYRVEEGESISVLAEDLITGERYTYKDQIGEGKLDMSIVEDVVSKSKDRLLIMRSTVNPGTCDYLAKKYQKHIVMQPEYLGETPNHPMSDQKARPFLILGGEPRDRRDLIELYQTVYNANTTIRQVTNLEAEIIKLSENRAIAFKVAECQELYDACEKAGVDYYIIRDAVYSDDPRFNLWWTFVYPDKRGFNSKCIPKDVYAWCAWAESLGYEPKITRSILEKNKKWLNIH